MAKQIIAGIGVNDDVASLAVIEADNDQLELKHLEEMRIVRGPFWYLELLDSVDKKLAGRMKKIAFSFDAAPVYLHSFPMDMSLAGGLQEEHAQWELSQVLPDYTPERYPSKILNMHVADGESVQNVVTIATDGNAINELQDALKEKKFHLGPVTAELTTVGRSLYRSHPEEKQRRSAFLHVGADKIQLVQYTGGEIAGYQTAHSADRDELIQHVIRMISNEEADMLYPYGSGLTVDWTKRLREARGKQFMPLNPFRRLRITPDVHNFGRFIGREYRFPSAVGAALSN